MTAVSSNRSLPAGAELLDAMPVAVYACHRDGTFAWYNRRAAELWGREPRPGDVRWSLCGSWRTRLPDGTLLRPDQSPMGQVLASGEPVVNRELVIERPDRSRVDVLVSINPIRDAAGAVAGAVAVFQDVSDRRRAEGALRESEGRFRAVVRNLPDYAIFLLDPRGFVLDWWEGAERVKGYTREEVKGRHVSIFYTPEQVASGAVERELREATERGRAEREDWRVRKGGGRFWGNEIATAMHDAGGKLIGFTKITRDLTDRKRMEDALRQSQERYRQVVEGVKDYAIFSQDCHRVVTHWNRAAAGILGYEEAEIVGRSADVIFTPEDRKTGAPDREQRQADAEGRGEDERWHVRKDGSRFWGSGILTAVRDEAGEVTGYFKVLRDRSGRKKLEDERAALLASERKAREEAEAAREEAEAATRLKDEFLTVASHELRTPLAAILLWSHLLSQGGLDERGRADASRVIRQQAEAQQRLIDDVLDVTRLSGGKLRLNVRPTDPAAAAAAAVDAVRPMADARGVSVTLSAGPAVGRVRADGDRLRQVVWNLLTNAVKFSDRGGQVRLRLERRGDEVRVTVSDTGRGIAPAFLPHVFDRFRQEDASSTRREGGLGLGLAIARQLVELHGGTISAQSAGEGQGATFTVRLPLPAVDTTTTRGAGRTIRGKAVRGQSARGTGARGKDARGKAVGTRKAPAVRVGRAAPAPPAALEGVRVLLVEDEGATREAVLRVLEQAGARVTAVASAAEALEALGADGDGDGPHVLLSDLGMAGVDGYELIRRMRAMEAERGRAPLPAAALTAYTREQDRRRALAAGFRMHIHKPVEPEELVRAVASLAREG